MAEFIHYKSCPVCASYDLRTVVAVKDYVVSNENFDVVECGNCGLRITQDVPDEVDIARYYKSENYISHTNTKKGLVNQLYHRVRKITLVQKQKWIEKWTKRQQGRLLDIGAGSGAFVQQMKSNGWEVTGLEPDPEARKVAQQDHGIVLNDTSLLEALSPHSFDAITLWHVLEHVHGLQDHVKKLKELLKADGTLFIAVPNYKSADAAYFGEYWAAYDVPRHLYHFSPSSMDYLLTQHELKIVAKIPMKFDSYYVSMLSNKYKTGSAKYLHSFIKGFQSNRRVAKQGASSIVYVIKRH